MESYFPYSFLFADGQKPDNLNLNFALQRSYSLEAEARDVYYNFGQNVLSNWSWGDPGTWWTFHEKGLDSVNLILDAESGGKIEHRNDYIARYQTEKITIAPDKGFRISGLLLETKDEIANFYDVLSKMYVGEKRDKFLELFLKDFISSFNNAFVSNQNNTQAISITDNLYKSISSKKNIISGEFIGGQTGIDVDIY